MLEAIAKLGREPPGAICAVLFTYVVIGGVAGSAIAVNADVPCWPQSTFYTVYAPCDDPIKYQLWFFAVSLPNVLISGPVRALVALTSDVGEEPIGVIIVTLNSTILAFLTFFGFAGWYARVPIAAWALLLALVGEIVYLRMLVPA